MGSYNAKPSTSDEKDHSVQPPTTSKQTDFNNSHPFTIEDTSDTDGDETHSKNSVKTSPSPLVKQIPESSEAVMQDEQRQRELAQERHREESRAPSGSSRESASPYGLYNPLASSNGGRPYLPASASPAVTGSGMNPGSLPLLQYPGQSAPPLLAINPTSSAVFSPYPSAFTSPAAAVYTAGLHSSANPRPYHGIESYSAMLASMGNQVQQHPQGHLIPAPSYFQGGYIPAQYNPLSPLMAGVIPTSKGMFPEGSYMPTAVAPHVLTGILPSGQLIPPAGQHPETSGEDHGRSSPEKHYSASTRYLEAREQQILESRRLAELQQLSPGGQVHRSIPEARVSPFQQVSTTVTYRVAMPEVAERPESKGASPGSSHQTKSVHIPSSKDVMLHCTTPKQALGGGDVDSSRQVQLALLPNTFYCGSVPGQAMVATTEGTIRVELPPPTVGINIGSKSGQPIPNPITMSLPITSSSSGGSIFTFPGSSNLPPLTSMPPTIAVPTAVPYQSVASRHHSPTYSATVAGLQSWHLTPQVRPTPSVRFQGSSLGPGNVAGSHQDGDQPMSGFHGEKKKKIVVGFTVHYVFSRRQQEHPCQNVE
ncbi:tensin-1-like [Lytechinus pictus]|uniref:tensin-1-like n=1 Tax=Lytechinus pictus TaxID=7653 RepID=UPI0030B9D368